MRKFLCIAALLICAAACIYPFDPDLGEAPKGILVVEGDIIVGGTTIIRLGTMESINSGARHSDAPSGMTAEQAAAHVWVEDSDGGVYEGHLADNRSPQFIIDTENAPADKEFRVCVEIYDARYSSDWSPALQGPEIKDIVFTPNDRSVFVCVSLDGGPEATGYVALSYDETWEFHAEYTLEYVVDTASWTVVIPMNPPRQENYWCWRSSDNHISYPLDFTGMGSNGVTAYPLFSFYRSDNRNHKKYCVNVKARTISKKTYQYLSHLDETSSGSGDLFTPNPGELPGNLRCETDPERQVLGYITASRITSKRAFMDSRYHILVRPEIGALSFITQDLYPNYYFAGYLPLAENPNHSTEDDLERLYGWGPMRCYDCVAAGGTKEEPDFWKEQ